MGLSHTVCHAATHRHLLRKLLLSNLLLKALAQVLAISEDLSAHLHRLDLLLALRSLGKRRLGARDLQRRRQPGILGNLLDNVRDGREHVLARGACVATQELVGNYVDLASRDEARLVGEIDVQRLLIDEEVAHHLLRGARQHAVMSIDAVEAAAHLVCEGELAWQHHHGKPTLA